jgi:tryptophan synthase alpha chain
VRSELPTDVPELVSKVRAHTQLPVMVGFGVSEPQHITAIGAVADGAVVGSALVNVIGREGETERLLPAVSEFAQRLAAAARG